MSFVYRSESAAEPKIYVMHENTEWVLPLREAFQEQGLPYDEWFVDDGAFDMTQAPPAGVFYNRMSASSHTRDHRFAAEYTGCVVAWLQAHGRRVINGGRAMNLEITKVGQYAAFDAFGIRTPRTLATVGVEHMVEAAQSFEGPFITKHNRAGKGLGVKLFRSTEALREHVESGAYEPSVDGVTLLQQYIEAPEPFITRVELIGREFIYAVRVDTSEGFELCPADACAIGDLACPVGEEAQAPAKFQIVEGFTSPLIEKYQRFMEQNELHIAAFEHIVDRDGNAYTYDMNINTNYNRAAEITAGGPFGMREVAAYLGRELSQPAAREVA